MQFEHETADYDEAESDHYGENANKKIVIIPGVLELLNLVFKVSFLIA